MVPGGGVNRKNASREVRRMDDRVAVYEANIEDMLRVIKDRLDEFKGNQPLDTFEQGRQLAYTEMWEIIQTRHQIIMEVLSEDGGEGE